ncbi:DUF6498-containing protein [Amycolatopsis sp. DG1A-15b]|uniref:DUF6498-containing protein n=1 Tax=Amycolatopsis sp. DG1A-15b TaxID=3052846 RepID=UPI00255B4305|nr:DUF6498-containing protein [Amycolatopsis sp. DG1A-15b]WIX85953.1 DUF6498-containing protein [Amycolatopsis sp. DG1A-15b]
MTEQPGRLAAYWERQLDKMEEAERKRARQLPGWRTRKHRRTLVVVLVLADLSLVAGAARFKVGPEWVFPAFWLSGLAVGGFAFLTLRVLTGRMSGGFSRLLDEREREWRHRVTYIGYQALSYLMVIALLYGLFTAETENGGVRGAMMLSALLVTGTTIPAIVLGWSLPDDDPEDFEEGMGNA